MGNYKFRKKHTERETADIQREIEDNLLPQVKAFRNTVPKNSEMTDGDMIAYKSGSIQKLYLKIKGKLYSSSLTEE